MKKLTGLFAVAGIRLRIYGGSAPASARVHRGRAADNVVNITPNADACWGKLLEAPQNDDAKPAEQQRVRRRRRSRHGRCARQCSTQTDWEFASAEGQRLQQHRHRRTGRHDGLTGNHSERFDRTSLVVRCQQDDLLMFEQALVVLKAGNTFIAYLFDIPLAAASTGTWDTSGLPNNEQGIPRTDLSHI